MIEPLLCDVNLYKIPSDEILEDRKIFYDLKRNEGEQINVWLDRVQGHIECCEFPNFVQYLLIDKFMCELDKNVMKFVRVAHTWSLEQFNEGFNVGNVNIGNINESANNLDVIKTELPDFYGYFHDNDEFNYEDNGTVKMEPHVTIEELPFSAHRQIVAVKNEILSHAIQEDSPHFKLIDETLDDVVKCGFENYEYSIDAAIETIVREECSIESNKNGETLELCQKIHNGQLDAKLKIHSEKANKAEKLNGSYRGVESTKKQALQRAKHVQFQVGHQVEEDDVVYKCSGHITDVRRGIRSFGCAVYNRCFTNTSNLKYHMRTHTGVRPFSCAQCEKSFTQFPNLKRHKLAIHHQNDGQNK